MGLKKLAEQVKEKELLRVAPPRACNMQQNTVAPATTDATPMQQDTVKASDGVDSTRNTVCNSNAQSLKKLCNKQGVTGGQFVASEMPVLHRGNVIDLRTYLAKLCQRLPMPPERLLRHYFTSEDLADIRAGRYPYPHALAAFIKTDPRYPFVDDSMD